MDMMKIEFAEWEICQTSIWMMLVLMIMMLMLADDNADAEAGICY